MFSFLNFKNHLLQKMFSPYPMDTESNLIAVIVAHPDDETLWAGGSILDHSGKQHFVASLCRKTDPDRAPKFKKALAALGADGAMGNMDDGSDQTPLAEIDVEEAILALLPANTFDMVITHSIYGEYTRHRRHEEIGQAVIRLWRKGLLKTRELRTFAFEDAGRTKLPAAMKNATLFEILSPETWQKKYNIITTIYGFTEDSWEARATPKEEAFRQFYSAAEAYNWLQAAQLTT
jgi:LmbE family N-acetylglucosaminyl deacetylase